MRRTRSKTVGIPIEQGEKLPRKHPETAEDWENYLTRLSYQVAEQRLLDGTASAQEVTHFLKIGSTKERLEREIMETQNELMAAKRDQIRSQKRMEELLSDAMAAFTEYRGGD